MANGKRSFLLYTDIHFTIKKLTDEQAGILFKHILSYVNDENPVMNNLIIELVFEPIKQQLKRDLKRYESICLRNKDNGSKGGRPKSKGKKPKKPSGLITNPNNPDGSRNNPNNPDEPDNDNDNDNDNDIEKEKNIIPPPIFLISKYCKERNNEIDPEYFYDWYQTRGWKVGKDKMKDWQSAIRTWEKRNKKPEPKLMMP
jgi:hypothetical protein